MHRSRKVPLSPAATALLGWVLFATATATGSTWTAGELAAHARDPSRLQEAIDRIGQMSGVQGVLVAHRGELVAERYFRGGGADKPHNLKSASKSVLSALAGIAIGEGLLRLDQPIAELLPGSAALRDPAKRAITVRHLLTMTTGLEPTSYDTYNEWIQTHDWVEAALARPLVAEPGTFYQYSTGTTHVLSGVIAAATGMSTREYAEQKLFGPLGIEVMGWQRDPAGTHVGGNNLSLKPRDMLRFGQLYLDGGRAGERSILPAGWVEESTRTGQSGLHVVYGTYRYLWWTDLYYRGAFSAVGYGGQYIYISPPHDAVVVVTATLESKGLEWTRRLFAQLRNGVLASFEPSPTYYAEQGRRATDPALDSLAQALAATQEQMERLRHDIADAPAGATSGRTTSRVNLREGPDTGTRRLTVLERGAAFEVIDRAEDWLHIQTADHQGWVHSDYTRLEEETTWRAALAPLGAELASFVSSARRALQDGTGISGEADPAGDDQVPVRLDGPDPVFAAEEGEVARLAGRADEFAPPPDAGAQVPGAARDSDPALRREIDALRRDRERLEAELEGARQALASRDDQLSDAEAQRDRLEAELGEERSRAGRLDAAIAERDRVSRDLEAATARIARLEEQAQRDAQSARQRADELAVELADAVDRASAAETRTALAQSSALSAANERDRLAADLVTERAARAEAERAAEAEARSRREESSRSSAELETVRRQNLELAESLQKEKQERRASEGERDRLAAELASARERLSGELSERQLDSAALAALETERDRLAGDLEEARRAADSAEKALATSRRDLEEARAGLEAQIATTRAESEDLAEELQLTRRQLEGSESERQRLAADLAATRDRMNTEVRTERARNAELETALDRASSSVVELTRERDQLADEVQEKTAERDRLRGEIEATREESRRLAGELDATRQALETARTDLAAALSSGEATSQETSKVANQLAATQRELAAAREEARRRADEVAELEADREVALARAAQEAEHLRSELEAAGRDLRASREALAAVRDSGHEASGAADLLRADLTASRERAAAAETAVDEAARRASAAELRASDAEAERARLNEELGSERARTAELEQRLLRAGEELAAAREARRLAEQGLSSTERLEQSIADLTARLAEEATARSMLAEALAEAERARDELTDRLRREASARNDEREALLARVAGLEGDTRRLQEELAAARERIAALDERPAAEPATDLRAAGAAASEERLAALEQALRGSEEISQRQAQELDGLRRELNLQGSALADAAADRTELANQLGAERAESARLRRQIAELEAAAEAARPAPRPAADASGVPGGRGGVQGFVRSWASALSRRDLGRFLGHYSSRFQPPTGLDLATWGERRIAEMADPSIRGLELEAVEVAPATAGGASARFVYRLKTTERDVSLTKTLQLAWENGGWRIVRESPLLH